MTAAVNVYFVSGHGAVGKTFLWSAIVAALSEPMAKTMAAATDRRQKITMMPTLSSSVHSGGAYCC
jgi:hypothetical protein